MSYNLDRFIRPVNPDAIPFFRWVQQDTDVVPYARRLYRDGLCQALFHKTFDESCSQSVFSSQPIGARSLSNPARSTRPKPPPQSLRLLGTFPLKILDGPGIEETADLPSRLLCPLSNDTFVAACGAGIHQVRFNEDGSFQATALVDIESELEMADEDTIISHVAVMDPRVNSFLTATTRGQLYHIVGPHLVRTIQDEESCPPVADMFSHDTSTFVVGYQNDTVRVEDVRTRRCRELSFADGATHIAQLPNSEYYATASECGLSVFDLRSTQRPTQFRATSSLVTALAWQSLPQGRSLVAAVRGSSPTLVVHAMDATLSPRTTAKTYGIVRSILCSNQEPSIITLREHSEKKCCIVWHYAPNQPYQIECMDVGQITTGDTPSCAALEPNNHSFIAAFPDGECFCYWPLVRPAPR